MPPVTGLPQRQRLSEIDPHTSMASLVGRDDSAERVIGATDAPLRQLVGDAYRDKDFRSLATLATGGVPGHFVEPLAHHLETSRKNEVIGGGLEVVGWMKDAARSRFERLVAENRPEDVHLQLETNPHATRQRQGTVPGRAELPTAQGGLRRDVGRATVRSSSATLSTASTDRPAGRTDSIGPARTLKSDRTFGLQLDFARGSGGRHRAKGE